jgi:hypothetical protein
MHSDPDWAIFEDLDHYENVLLDMLPTLNSTIYISQS